ncbi:hypothetical protein K1719_009720 [Acacia pycnantha]|nr:hypothetical protein K1719_009720 [Acacia pycnantha]
MNEELFNGTNLSFWPCALFQIFQVYYIVIWFTFLNNSRPFAKSKPQLGPASPGTGDKLARCFRTYR